jgi:hypothetical protein
MRRRCPVCRQLAIPTAARNVAGHLDRIGRETCPMTGHPYELTVITKR